MNKKRKILTMVAMVAFGAIILLHHVTMGWGWIPTGKLLPATQWSNIEVGYSLTETEDGQPLYIYTTQTNGGYAYYHLVGVWNNTNVIRLISWGKPDGRKAPIGTTVKNGRIQYPTASLAWGEDGTGKSPFFVRWTNPEKRGWSNGLPILPDIQTILFVLAVFYVGLFFVLGESTPPTKPKAQAQ
jgi:hypothetical protein